MDIAVLGTPPQGGLFKPVELFRGGVKALPSFHLAWAKAVVSRAKKVIYVRTTLNIFIKNSSVEAFQ